jgi:hypothetical protein
MYDARSVASCSDGTPLVADVRFTQSLVDGSRTRIGDLTLLLATVSIHREAFTMTEKNSELSSYVKIGRCIIKSDAVLQVDEETADFIELLT